MKQLFQDIQIDSIMTFLKEINLLTQFNLVIFKPLCIVLILVSAYNM